MNDWGIVSRVIENIGTSGLLMLLIYKLTDRWAGKFLEAQTSQATAVTDLANAIKTSVGDQRELLLAVRVLATKQEETKLWVEELARVAAHKLTRPGGEAQ